MAYIEASSQQDSWVQQLEVNVRSGYTTFLDSWQSASKMLQEQIDIMNPGCTCKRHCDTAQLIMPTIVADDEVAYAYSNEAAGGPSPFSPRKKGLSVHALPVSNITSAASMETEMAHPQQTSNESDDRSETMCKVVAPMAPIEQSPSHETAEAVEPCDLSPPAEHMNNFGYYQEYMPVLRPPSSIMSNFTTAVRPAPWDKWTKPQKATSASSQTGSSLVSKGAVGVSQAASVLGNVQPSCPSSTITTTFESGTTMREEAACSARIMPEEASDEAAVQTPAGAAPVAPPVQAASVEEIFASSEWTSCIEQETKVQPTCAPAVTSVSSRAEVISSTNSSVPKETDLIIGHVAPDAACASNNKQEELPAAPATRRKTRSEAKSVLSLSTAPKSSAAMALSEATAGSSQSVAKSRRAGADDRKSALSTAVPMKSSAAMALAGLGKVNSKPRGNASDCSSVLELPATTKPASVLDLSKPAKPAATETSAATRLASTLDVPKPAKPAAKRAGSRSKGPDAKSVISGLNSSSSASALLGPMLQGQPKRRSARPDGADVASVV